MWRPEAFPASHDAPPAAQRRHSQIAAPAAGISHYIRSISINSAATISVTIGAGETTGAVTAALIGPVNLVAGATANFVFNPAMMVGAATALTVDASGEGAICVVAQGETY